MILVTGVSSSGKTHTLELLVRATPDFRHVRASEMLRSLGRPVENLTVEAALVNQTSLVAELGRLKLLSDQRTVLDGHATVDTASGTLPLPDETFDALAPRMIAHIEADPASIAKRRACRGLSWDANEVAERQSVERTHARAQAQRLGVPFCEIPSGDVNAFLRFAGGAVRK